METRNCVKMNIRPCMFHILFGVFVVLVQMCLPSSATTREAELDPKQSREELLDAEELSHGFLVDFENWFPSLDKNNDGKVTIGKYEGFGIDELEPEDEALGLFVKLFPDRDAEEVYGQLQLLVSGNDRLCGKVLSLKELCDIYATTIVEEQSQIKERSRKEEMENQRNIEAAEREAQEQQKGDKYAGDVSCPKCATVTNELYDAMVGAADGTGRGKGERRFIYSLHPHYVDDIFEDVCEEAMKLFGLSEMDIQDAAGNWISRPVYVHAQPGWSDELNMLGIYESLRQKCFEIVGEFEDFILEQSKPHSRIPKETFQEEICENETRLCGKGLTKLQGLQTNAPDLNENTIHSEL